MGSTDATLFKLNFKAGFNRESTQYAEEGKWFDGDHVRFWKGRPENIRGYVKKNASQFDGTARDLLVWTNPQSEKLISFATEKKWYVYYEDSFFDITPIVSTQALVSAFSTSVGSFYVNVSIANHLRSSGDFIEFTSATEVGGSITLDGTYEVVSVVDADNFIVSATVPASATEAAGGGSPTINYLLETGTTESITGLGWGAGVYNAGVSVVGGRAFNEPAASGDITFAMSQWSLDNWGVDMVGCRRGGNIFYYDEDAGLTPQRAVIVTAAPTVNDAIIVSPNDRHLISLGCTGYDAPYSALRVRWCDQENFNNWVPSVSSTAGEVDLIGGSHLVGAVRSRNQINLFSDTNMFGMQYVGRPATFKFYPLGSNCGLIGPHAVIDMDGNTLWMGHNNFYIFDGTVRALECPVRRYIFERLNTDHEDKIYAGINSEFKEIVWLFPSIDGTECDSYLFYNMEENHWVYGTSKWTTWGDRGVFDDSIVTGSDGYLFDNEPLNIMSFDGEANTSYLESADFDFEEGKNIVFTDKIIPDFTINDGNISFTLNTKMYPNGKTITKGPYLINSATEKVDLRARGRQANVRIECSSTDTSWRMGEPRMAGQVDGER